MPASSPPAAHRCIFADSKRSIGMGFPEAETTLLLKYTVNTGNMDIIGSQYWQTPLYVRERCLQAYYRPLTPSDNFTRPQTYPVSMRSFVFHIH
jgi:hypothetical protein